MIGSSTLIVDPTFGVGNISDDLGGESQKGVEEGFWVSHGLVVKISDRRDPTGARREGKSRDMVL